jgi:hypothetical protein
VYRRIKTSVFLLGALLLLTFVCFTANSVRATVGLSKSCVPAYEAEPPPVYPCSGMNWSTAFPGKCMGATLTDPMKCRQDGTTKIPIHQYQWGFVDEDCVKTLTGAFEWKDVGNCSNYSDP